MAYRDVCEIAKQLNTAVDWLRDQGIRIPTTGRHSVYQRVLNQACRAWLAGREKQDIAPFPDMHDLFVAFCEASDLWWVSNLPPELIRKNCTFVQRIIAGQSSYTRAASHDQGRDSQFQLMTASLFSRAGGIVSLDDPADVVAIVGYWPVAIECKRPTTIVAMRNSIERAYDQFRTHEQNNLNAVRIIAIDLSVLINPNFDVLVSQSDAAAARFVSEQVKQLFAQASDVLARAARNSQGKARVDGFLFRILCVVREPSGGRERIGEFWRIAPLSHSESQSRLALDEIVRSLPGFDSVSY